ncbi:MAG TPA: ABC transporter substrate-binding protein [Acidimicrobiales bacterium]|nr:ABC transporter substrate-binding protein [Acidimicrobiales bacterium]
MTDRIDRRSFLARSAVAGAGLAVAGASGGLLSACSSSNSSSSTTGGGSTGSRPDGVSTATPKRGGSLVFGVDAEEKGFSPTQGTFDEVGIMYARTVFDTLMILDANGEPQPNLAESVTSNASGTVWTITVRPNVTFHNGTPCDGAAVAANFKAHQASLLTGPALTPIQSIDVTGPLVVTITMKTPWVPFNYYLCGGIGSQFAFIAEPTWLASGSQTNPVGTGPFIFQDWVPNDHFTATRNPKYWRTGMPYLDSITYRPIPDPQQLLASLNSGAIDIMHTDTASDISQLRSNTSLAYCDDSVKVAGEPDMSCIQLNLSKAPFDNLKLRQAMAYATSSPQYVKVIDGGVTEPSNGVFTSTSPYYLADNGYPAFNLSKAKQLVSEVKASGGSVSFTLGHTPDPKGSQIGQYLQQQLQQAGMTVTLQPILQDSIINVALTGAYQALTWRQFGAVNPDLNYIFWSPTNADTPGFAINMARNNDPAMQTALLQGRSATDKAGQVAAYQQVNRLLSKDIPYVWYARAVWAFGAVAKVQNFNNPTTPAGNKAFGQIGGSIWPQQIWLS